MFNAIIVKTNLPARMALCAWNSRPPTDNVTSLNFSLSKRLPKSSDSLHSGTLNWITLLCPEIFTLSATTLTYDVSNPHNNSYSSSDGGEERGKRENMLSKSFKNVSIIMKSRGVRERAHLRCLRWKSQQIAMWVQSGSWGEQRQTEKKNNEMWRNFFIASPISISTSPKMAKCFLSNFTCAVIYLARTMWSSWARPQSVVARKNQVEFDSFPLI